MKKVLGASVALWALFAGGCGTLFNVGSGDFIPYGGVARDFAWIAGASTSSTSATSAGKGGAIALLILLPSEVSLSFVADTLTLPLTLYLHPRAAHYDPIDGHDDEDEAKASSQPLDPAPPSQSATESTETTAPKE